MRSSRWKTRLPRIGAACVLVLTVATCASIDDDASEAGSQLRGAFGEIATDLVWPPAPETARYRLSAVLIGEDAVTGKDASGNFLSDVARVITGIAVGDTKLRELQRPTSGLTQSDGTVLVVDAGLKAVVRFDFAKKDFDVWDQSGRRRGFKSPIAVAEDGKGGFLVTDSELGRVIRLGPNGEPRGEFGAKILTRPTGLARDPKSGAIFVADSATHQIRKFDASGRLTRTIGGPGETIGRFNGPTYLSFSDDRLFVADTLNFRIQSFDANGRAPRAFGRAGLYVGQFTRPKGVAVGDGGRIYVVESQEDHLLVFDPDGRLLLPIEGRGAVGPFYLPAGVWTDAKRNVYVADMFNGRIVVFEELTKMSEG